MIDHSVFETNAATLRALKNQIDAAFTNRQRDESHYGEWADACQRFHLSFDRLAFPGGLERELTLLKCGDAQAVEMAVRYLEADPWYFRSGYIKEQLLKELKGTALREDQRHRLRAVILERINKGCGREFRRYCRLARTLTTTEFAQRVRKAMRSADVNISRRAGWVMTSLES